MSGEHEVRQSPEDREARGPSLHVVGCACLRCVGFSDGNIAALKHGATSERRVSTVATVQKRRFLRQNGLRMSDMEGVGLALLDNYARAQAKVELLDAWFAENGLLDNEGAPQPSVRVYFSALSASRTALSRLSEHIKGTKPRDPLRDYLAENYGRGADSE